MEIETKLALVDAAHWTECTDRVLRDIMTLADALDDRLREIDQPLLALDAGRIANKVATTIIRVQHIQGDLDKLKTQLDPTPTT